MNCSQFSSRRALRWIYLGPHGGGPSKRNGLPSAVTDRRYRYRPPVTRHALRLFLNSSEFLFLPCPIRDANAPVLPRACKIQNLGPHGGRPSKRIGLPSSVFLHLASILTILSILSKNPPPVSPADPDYPVENSLVMCSCTPRAPRPIQSKVVAS